MHINLFAWAADDHEVYAALQRDTKRDIGVRQALNMIFLAAVAYLSRHLPGLDQAAALGSGLIDGHSQNMTVAARAMAEKKAFGHLS